MATRTFSEDEESSFLGACGDKPDLNLVKGLVKQHPTIARAAKDEDGTMGFHFACYNGKLQIVEYLLGVDPTFLLMKNDNGSTGFHFSCGEGNLETTKYLLGVDSTLHVWTDNKGNTGFHYACYNGSLDLVKYLLEVDSTLLLLGNSQGSIGFHDACGGGYLDTVQYLLEVDSTLILQKTNFEQTGFHEACFAGKLDTVKFLVGIDPTILQLKEEHGRTGFHYACRYGDIADILFYLNIVKYLLGVDSTLLLLTDNYGLTGFHLACFKGKLEIVQYLLGVDPTVLLLKDNKDKTGLDYAKEKKRKETVDFLLQQPKKRERERKLEDFKKELMALHIPEERASQHAQAMVAEGFEKMKDLEGVSEEELKEMGVAMLFDRKRIHSQLSASQEKIVHEKKDVTENASWEPKGPLLSVESSGDDSLKKKGEGLGAAASQKKKRKREEETEPMPHRCSLPKTPLFLQRRGSSSLSGSLGFGGFEEEFVFHSEFVEKIKWDNVSKLLLDSGGRTHMSSSSCTPVGEEFWKESELKKNHFCFTNTPLSPLYFYKIGFNHTPTNIHPTSIDVNSRYNMIFLEIGLGPKVYIPRGNDVPTQLLPLTLATADALPNYLKKSDIWSPFGSDKEFVVSPGMYLSFPSYYLQQTASSGFLSPASCLVWFSGSEDFEKNFVNPNIDIILEKMRFHKR